MIILIGFSLSIAAYVHKKDVVRDTKSTLVWQDNKVVEVQEMTHSDANQYCKDLSLEGRKDWRLPTVIELQKIVDFKRFEPAIQRAFYYTGFGNYWSSTIYTDDSVRAWAVDFQNGSVSHNRDSYSYYVRCVRGK